MNDAAAAKQAKGLRRATSRVVFVMVIALGLYLVFAFASDIHKVQKGLAGFGWWAFAAALGLAFGNYVRRVLKW